MKIRNKSLKSRHYAAIAAFCALGIAACQPPRAAGHYDEPAHRMADRGNLDSCFNANQLNNWRVVGRRTVNIGIGASKVYQLTLQGNCPDLDIKESMAFESSNNLVCHPADATIIINTPIGSRRCHVRDIRRMSEAEINSLRPGERP